MGKDKKKYIIYDRDEMREKSILNLTLSQFKRLRVMPKWYVYVIISVVILTVFGIMLYEIVHDKEVYEHEIEMYSEELKISENNNDLYCLIGEYALRWNTPLPEDSCVFQFIKDAGAWYPDIIMAQWCLESTHGTSDIAVNANNHFGMRPVKTRPTLQEKDRDYKGYGVYRNWQWSVLDRILWDIHVFDTVPSRENYLKTIKGVYAEDKDYIPKITGAAKKWKIDAEQEKIKEEKKGNLK